MTDDTQEPVESRREPRPTDPASTSVDTVPRWTLALIVLLLIGVLIHQLREQLTPLAVALSVLILLYPLRRTRELKGVIALVTLVTVILIWQRLSSILIPFVIAFIIAYAVNPLVERLSAKGLSRLLISIMLMVVIGAGTIGAGILIVPRLFEELTLLAASVKEWITSLRDWSEHTLIPWLSGLDIPLSGAQEQLKAKLPGLIGGAVNGFANWSTKALSGVVALLSGLLNLILIPIFTVYFLIAFDRIRHKVYGIIPARYRELAYRVYGELNRILALYFRGQLLVCLFLSAWIGLGLWLVAGLPYALLLGIVGGVANLLPYIGTTLAASLTVIIALFQPDPLVTALKASAVFISGQVLEGTLITPRLVGGSVGLHPLLVIIAVLLFANFFGFLGMLVAIPATACLIAVIKLWMEHRVEAR